MNVNLVWISGKLFTSIRNWTNSLRSRFLNDPLLFTIILHITVGTRLWETSLFLHGVLFKYNRLLSFWKSQSRFSYLSFSYFRTYCMTHIYQVKSIQNLFATLHATHNMTSVTSTRVFFVDDKYIEKNLNK